MRAELGFEPGQPSASVILWPLCPSARLGKDENTQLPGSPGSQPPSPTYFGRALPLSGEGPRVGVRLDLWLKELALAIVSSALPVGLTLDRVP